MLQIESNADKLLRYKVHGANMGPIWGRQDPGGPHVGPMKFAIPVHDKYFIIGQYQYKCLNNREVQNTWYNWEAR